jgi:xanthine dehydrogenase accessory factor
MSIAGSRHEVTRQWLAEGRRFAVATLVETVGSAPLDPGATMLVDEASNIEGSVTGGCVEGALVAEAQEVLSGSAPRVLTYGISDDEAAGVGLMCGGTVRIFVEELGEEAGEIVDGVLEAVQEGRPAAVATLLDGPSAGSRMALADEAIIGTLGAADLLDRTVGRDLRGALDQAVSGIRRYGADGAAMGSDLRVYFQAYAVPPSMVIFGAIDYSVAVARLARELGYNVTIVDPREPFLASPRFSEAAEIVVDWPDRYLDTRDLRPRDVVLVFSHDPKLDQPALISALASGAGYVGALGSRRTHEKRVERLREAGVAEGDIKRIAAPCGLDLGARTPAQTAVSILGEIIATQNRRGGESLSETTGAIHDRPAGVQPAA